jgi:hypothetical protein
MTNDKQTFYVSVKTGTVFPTNTSDNYEFEIVATGDEAAELQRFMNQRDSLEAETWVRAQLPGIPYHQDEVNDRQDAHLFDTYRRIAALGSDKTKAHLARMGFY